MLQFLDKFFLSWTAILTVTGWYWFSKLVFEGRDLSAAMMACYAAFGILLTAQLGHIIYTKWIRPTGFVLIREAEYTQLLLIKEHYDV